MANQYSKFFDVQYKNKQPPLQKKSRLKSYLNAFNTPRDDAVYRLLKPGARLLDVGCGDGEFLLRAKNMFSSLYGVDVAESRIQRATAMFSEAHLGKAVFKRHDLNEDLPFEDDYFNTVVSIVTIDFVYDFFKCISQIHRVLVPQGQFILAVANHAYLRNRFKLLMGKLPTSSAIPRAHWPTTGWDAGATNYFTQETLTEALAYCGFRTDTIKGAGILTGLKDLRPSLLSGTLVINARAEKQGD